MKQEVKAGLKFKSKNFIMSAEIIEINEDKNTASVLLTPIEGTSWVENNWNLQHTIWGFENGEYFASPSSPTVHTEQEQEGFTGGNWQLDESENGLTLWADDERDNGIVLATIYTEAKEWQANADLIAESKNMYAFIKEMAARYGNSQWIAGEANKIINRIKQ